MRESYVKLASFDIVKVIHWKVTIQFPQKNNDTSANKVGVRCSFWALAADLVRESVTMRSASGRPPLLAVRRRRQSALGVCLSLSFRAMQCDTNTSLAQVIFMFQSYFLISILSLFTYSLQR